MATRRLVTYVNVGGTVYGPEDDVPAEVAEAITNPKAWAADKETPAVKADTGAKAGTSRTGKE